MNDGQALLTTILQFPAEDTPRLGFADWLEENSAEVECGTCDGDGLKRAMTINGRVKCPTCSGTGRVPDGRRARAEFIRCQIEIARLLAIAERWATTPSDQPGGSMEDGGPAGAALAESQNLQRRERDLWDGRWEDWSLALIRLMGPLSLSERPPHKYVNTAFDADQEMLAYCHPPNDPDGEHIYWRFRRGFVSEIHCTCAAFQQHAAEIFAAQPVTAVTISDKRPLWDEGRSFCTWAKSPYQSESYVLPRAIFRKLPHNFARYVRDTVHHYETEDLARAALSAAAVSLGRDLAGLPPLTPAPASAPAPA